MAYYKVSESELCDFYTETTGGKSTAAGFFRYIYINDAGMGETVSHQVDCFLTKIEKDQKATGKSIFKKVYQ